MYLKFYGLSEKPFSQTPDPRFLYWNDSYREALASLRYGIQERKGFLTMIGEAGTGKTTLLRKLLDDLGPDVVSVFLFNPNASFEEILEYTLSELGIMVSSGRKLAMLQRLNEFLLAAFAEGKNTILLIDEAQDLDTEVLESLRLLSNLETAKEKILQIVLSGQTELATRLAQDNLRQLKQRIAVRCRLEPLQRAELGDYIRARLRVAGADEALFDEGCLDAIWGFASGIPRLVNTVCDNALLVGYAVGKSRIDRAVVQEVVADLQRLDARPAPSGASGAAAATGTGPVPATPPPAPAAAHEPSPAPPRAPAAPAPAPPVVHPAPASDRSTAPAPAPAPHVREPATHEGAGYAPRTKSAPAAAAAAPRRSGAGRIAALLVAALALLAGGVWLGTRLRPAEVGPAAPTRLAERDPKAFREPAAAPPPAPAPAAAAAPAAPAAPAQAAPAAPPASGAPAEPPAAVGSAPVPDPAPAPEEAAVGAVPPSGGEVRTLAGSAAPAAPPVPPAPASAAPSALADGPARRDPGAAPALPPPALDAPGELARPAVREPTSPDDDDLARSARRGRAAPASELPGAEPPPAEVLAAVDRGAQVVQDSPSGGRAAGKEVRVRTGDTLYQLAWRTYGTANYTTLDMLRAANPEIHDVNRIAAGGVLVFPDPGPEARIVADEGSLSVLAITTPEVTQAEGVQRKLQEEFGRKVEIQPVVLGEGQRLYRVSLRELQGESQARSIAQALGTILDDPDERPGS